MKAPAKNIKPAERLSPRALAFGASPNFLRPARSQGDVLKPQLAPRGQVANLQMPKAKGGTNGNFRAPPPGADDPQNNISPDASSTLPPVRTTWADTNGIIGADELNRVIKPHVRDRFTSVAMRGLTPQGVQDLLIAALGTQTLRSQLDLFSLMEDTWPMLAKCSQELKRALLSAQWRVDPYALPGQKATPEAQRRADLVEASMQTWRPAGTVPDENGWDGFVHDLADAWTRGISVQEILWAPVEDVRGLGPAILPRASAWVMPGFYALRDDVENGTELRLYLNQSSAGDGFLFPPDKFVIATHRARTGFLAQTAMLRPLAAMWIAASFAQDWALNLAQLFGLPFRWVTYDTSAPASQRDNILSMLQLMGSAGYAAFPTGTELKLHELSKDAKQSPQVWLIDFADKAVQILLLGQSLTTDVGDSGSRALGNIHFYVRADVIEAMARWAANQINDQLVPAIIRLNFGDEAMMPRIICDVEEEENAKANAEVDKILIGELGLPVSRKWLYDRHGIPLPLPGEDLFISRPQRGPVEVPGITPEGDITSDAPFTVDMLPGHGGGGAAAPAGQKTEDGAQPPEDPAMKAKAIEEAATSRIVDSTLERLTNIEAKWLAGVKPFFRELIVKAKDSNLSDADFELAVAKAARQMPELFAGLNTRVVQDALFNAMSAGLVNGATLGWINRQAKKKGGAQ